MQVLIIEINSCHKDKKDKMTMLFGIKHSDI